MTIPWLSPFHHCLCWSFVAFGPSAANVYLLNPVEPRHHDRVPFIRGSAYAVTNFFFWLQMDNTVFTTPAYFELGGAKVRDKLGVLRERDNRALWLRRVKSLSKTPIRFGAHVEEL